MGLRSLAMQESGHFEGFWVWMPWPVGGTLSVSTRCFTRSRGSEAWRGIADPVYDALYEAAEAAGTGSEEQKRLSREMELRQLEMHWFIWGTESPQFNANWPWLKGYNGETTHWDTLSSIGPLPTSGLTRT